MRYSSIEPKLVTADEIENGIRRLMENGDKSSTEGIKQKVKEMSEKSKVAIKEGGSSYNSIGLTAEEIDIGIRKLMEGGNACGEEIKQRVKEMSKKIKRDSSCPRAKWPSILVVSATASFEGQKRDSRLAVDIKLDYKKDICMSNSSNVMLVTAEEIENGIRKLMESENECGKERKQRVKEMSEKSKVAVVEGGSSYNSIELWIEDFMKTT
ncbi:hypothetical protein C3L33_13078, partial [Rhododendron williamsianum]